MLSSPEIVCHELRRAAAGNLDEVRGRFEDVPPCVLRQAWLAQPEAGFASTSVRTGWHNQSLWVFAELTDISIFTTAKNPNERLWELGDTFEIFLRPVNQEAYVELHIAPNNLRLHLRFADANAAVQAGQTGSFEKLAMPGDAFGSTTWLLPELDRWFVLAEIPASIICQDNSALQGSEWFFSFSRFDYTRGLSKPVISSTSSHTLPDFHRQQEWGRLRFC